MYLANEDVNILRHRNIFLSELKMSIFGNWQTCPSPLVCIAFVTMSLSQKHCKNYVATLLYHLVYCSSEEGELIGYIWAATRFIVLIIQNRCFYPDI